MEHKHLTLSWGERLVIEGGTNGKLRGAYAAPRSGRITHVLVQRGLRRRSGPLTLDSARQEADGVLVLPEQQRQTNPGPGRGSVPFTAKTVVHCSDGTSLPLQGLIMDRQRHNVEYILAGSQGNAHAIPFQQVQKLASGSPSVTLGQADLEALPVFRPDDEAQRNALAALERADPTGDTFQSVHLQVVDGTAHLDGNVRLPIQSTDVQRAVGQAKGVLRIESAIATDWDLGIAIAEALAQEGLMRQGLVLVKSTLGRVTLSGHLPDQELIDTAVAVAAGVPGVRSVEDSIQVKPVIAEEPAITPEPAPEQPDDAGEAEQEAAG